MALPSFALILGSVIQDKCYMSRLHQVYGHSYQFRRGHVGYVDSLPSLLNRGGQWPGLIEAETVQGCP